MQSVSNHCYPIGDLFFFFFRFSRILCDFAFYSLALCIDHLKKMMKKTNSPNAIALDQHKCWVAADRRLVPDLLSLFVVNDRGNTIKIQITTELAVYRKYYEI